MIISLCNFCHAICESLKESVVLCRPSENLSLHQAIFLWKINSLSLKKKTPSIFLSHGTFFCVHNKVQTTQVKKSAHRGVTMGTNAHNQSNDNQMSYKVLILPCDLFVPLCPQFQTNILQLQTNTLRCETLNEFYVLLKKKKKKRMT